MKFHNMEQYSRLIGSIYDCAIDPALWPDTIATICSMTDCMAGAIRVSDLENSRLHLVQSWNYDAATLADMSAHAAGIVAFWSAVPNFRSRPLDEPASVRRELPRDVIETSRYNIEWARPRGVIDVLALMVLREPTRLGDFTLSRHERFGPVTDDNLDTMRLLAPHIRRAVTIGDLMDMKTLELQALRATLDTVTAGIVVVGAEARILHANDAARRMLDARSPIVSLRGCLLALHPEANRELAKAIALARSNEAGIGAAGIGVPLFSDSMAAATAHVLPLACGDLRTRLVPQAVAAVFIVPAGTPMPRRPRHRGAPVRADRRGDQAAAPAGRKRDHCRDLRRAGREPGDDADPLPAPLFQDRRVAAHGAGHPGKPADPPGAAAATEARDRKKHRNIKMFLYTA